MRLAPGQRIPDGDGIMGRLVDAALRKPDEEHQTFDEARFLEEAGQIAARLQSELTVSQLQSVRSDGPESLAGDRREEPEGLRIYPEEAQCPVPGGDIETSALSEQRLIESMRNSLQEQLKAARADETGGQTPKRDQEDTRIVERCGEIVEECDRTLAGLTDEEQKTNEEIGRAWSDVAAEQQRIRKHPESELARREQDLTRQRNELSSERLRDREELNRDRERQLQEINAARAEFACEQDVAIAQLEYERRESSSRLERAQDELLEMRQTVEHDVARNLGDLEREKSAWESHQEETRIRLREAKLKHEQSVERVREELSLLTEREREKLAKRCQEVEQLKSETSAHCEREHRDLEHELLSQRTAWVQQQQLERDQWEKEKATLQQSVEELQTALNERRQQHEQALREERGDAERELLRQREEQDIELALQRRQTEGWIQQETTQLEQERQQALQELENERQRFEERTATENTRMECEQEERRASLDSERKEFDDECRAWHVDRGREAAILQAERHEIERIRTRLESEQERINAELNNLSTELNRSRTAHDEQLRCEEQLHKEGILQAERELQGRGRIMDEKVQQTDAELTARCRLVGDELRTMRKLHEKQLAHDKEAFAQACTRRNSELEREAAETEQGREKLEHERRELASQFERARQQFSENIGKARKAFEAETSRVRQQLEQERRVLRNGLSQMNAQLVSVATSLEEGPAHIASEKFDSSDEQISAAELLEQLGDDTVEPAASSPLIAEFAIPPVEFAECADLADQDVGSELPLNGEADYAAEVSAACSAIGMDAIAISETDGAGRPDMTKVPDQSPVDESTGGATLEWACIVETRSTESSLDAVDRRTALEGYRSQLGELQSQLQELAVASEGTEAVL